MITTCPSGFIAASSGEAETKEAAALLTRKCNTWSAPGSLLNFDDPRSDFYLSIPLTTKSGVTYANYYCAVCNSVAEDFSFWKLLAKGNLLRAARPGQTVDKTKAFRFPSFVTQLALQISYFHFLLAAWQT